MTSSDFYKRTTFVVALCTAILLGLALAWIARTILLLLFAGILGALVLSSATNWCQAKLRVPRHVALTVVIVVFLCSVALAVWLRGPAILQQFGALQTDLPAATRQVLARVQDQTWGRWLLSRYMSADQLEGNLSFALTKIGGAVLTTVSFLIGSLVVVAFSLYIAAEPHTYLKGLHRLTPPPFQAKLDACVTSAIQMLRSWLMAKLLSMLFIGTFVSVGLWLLGIPLGGTLGIIAGFLTFVPNLGPVLSFLPAALLAFAVGPTKGILTLVLFCAAHFLEGNIVTPLLERQIAALPPALTLVVQLGLATIAGALGVALAAPLTAAAIGILRVALPSNGEGSELSPLEVEALRPTTGVGCLRTPSTAPSKK